MEPDDQRKLVPNGSSANQPLSLRPEQEREILIRTALMALRTTFHSDSPLEAMIPVWKRALMGLTADEVRHGVTVALREHKSEFMPAPAMVRAWGTGWAGTKAQEPPRPGSQHGIEWYMADDPAGGQPIAWHAGLKDKDGNPIPQDPNLTWIKCCGTRGVPVQQLLDPCPECHKGKGTPKLAFGGVFHAIHGAVAANGENTPGIGSKGLPGGRFSIVCDSCNWTTGRHAKMREAISEWNR